MRRWPILLLGLALATPWAQAISPPPMAIGAELTLQLPDRDAAAAALIAKAEALGGYFSEAGNEGVVLKVPAAQADTMIEHARTLGTPIAQSYRSDAVQGEIDQLQARLKAKLELYERMQAMLAGAEAKDVVAVHVAAARLIREIEQLKGQQRALQHRLAYARVAVRFRPQAPRGDDGPASPFGWLNALGLEPLLQEFER